MSVPGIWSAGSIAELGQAVTQVLGAAEAFRFRRSRLSPRLSYGRHRGPCRIDSRRAAVLIVIYPHRRTGQLCLTLTRRPTGLSHHGGQICLPGGRIEAGESPTQAALREYREELGVRVDVVKELGRLPPIYVFASDNLVETLVVTAKTPGPRWNPDPAEVDEVIEMPLEGLVSLIDESKQGRSRQGQLGGSRRSGDADDSRRFRIVARKKDRIGKECERGEVFRYGFGYQAIEFVDIEGRPREVWGATAMLLDEFACVVQRALS